MPETQEPYQTTPPAASDRAPLEIWQRADISPRELYKLRRELADALAQNETLRAQVETYRQGEAKLLERIERLENGPVVREVRG